MAPSKKVLWGLDHTCWTWKRCVVISNHRLPVQSKEGPPIYVHWKGRDRRQDIWIYKTLPLATSDDQLREVGTHVFNEIYPQLVAERAERERQRALIDPPTAQIAKNDINSLINTLSTVSNGSGEVLDPVTLPRKRAAPTPPVAPNDQQTTTQNEPNCLKIPKISIYIDHDDTDDDVLTGAEYQYQLDHEEMTRHILINNLTIGSLAYKATMPSWYFTPLPPEYQGGDIHACVFCLTIFKYHVEWQRHLRRCTAKHPPGAEIYRTDSLKGPEAPPIAIWELDGTFAKVYCQNLCLISKLFLDHKTLRHPVNLFLFYALTELRTDGYHFVGYFSKEKFSSNNVSCIMVLPEHQVKGYGKFLINFSYALASREGKRGTPERPLSDLGRITYLRFWRNVLIRTIWRDYIEAKGGGRTCDDDREVPSELPEEDERHPSTAPQTAIKVEVESLANRLSFEPVDVIDCFQSCGLIIENDVSKFIYLTEERMKLLLADLGRAPPPIEAKKLRWIPYDAFTGPFEIPQVEEA